MRIWLFLFSAIVLGNYCAAQRPLTKEDTIRINKQISQEIPALKSALKKGLYEASEVEITFSVDTFKIERFSDLAMDIDYSTAGMNNIVYEAADKYDVLLNKYYKLLLGQLQPDDKKLLIEAQRAWVTFRDNELKLYGALRKDEYSGGGTIQTNFSSGEYLSIIQDRVLDLFHYYDEIMENKE